MDIIKFVDIFLYLTSINNFYKANIIFLNLIKILLIEYFTIFKISGWFIMYLFYSLNFALVYKFYDFE